MSANEAVVNQKLLLGEYIGREGITEAKWLQYVDRFTIKLRKCDGLAKIHKRVQDRVWKKGWDFKRPRAEIEFIKGCDRTNSGLNKVMKLPR